MWRKAAVALTLVMALVFAGLMYHASVEERQVNQELVALKQECAQLEREKESLRQEIDTAKTEYELKLRPVATEEFIFLSLGTRLYEVVYPQSQEYEFCGVMALTPYQVPGDEGCITVAQCLEMCRSGWTTCALCDSTEDLDEWYDLLTQRLLSINFRTPKTVILPDNEYDEAVERKLLELGFTFIVFEGQYDADILFAEPQEDHWTLGGYAWNFSGIRNDLEGLVSNGANRAFFVDVSLDANFVNGYHDYRFRRMLDYLAGYREKGFCEIGDFLSISDYRREKTAENGLLEAEMHHKLTELEQQKDAVQAQLNERYSRWKDQLTAQEES